MRLLTSIFWICILVLIVVSITCTAIDKIRCYNSSHHSIDLDNEEVRVEDADEEE